MDGQKGLLRNAVWLLLCQQMAKEERSCPALRVRSHQTAPNMARKGRSAAAAAAAAYPPPPPPPPDWGETPPSSCTPNHSPLSSINSLHTGQQPWILHIPPVSYLKFISNNCSIKGNVCKSHAAVITGLAAGLAAHVDNGKSLWTPVGGRLWNCWEDCICAGGRNSWREFFWRWLCDFPTV